MLEKIDFIKWFTQLSPQKKITAYTLLIIIALGFFGYGLGEHLKGLYERDRKECLDNNIRITAERDYFQKRLENSQEKYLNYIESQVKKYQDLSNKTEELKKTVNENN